jgi:NADH-quinone oxidoreductase subunit N
VSLLGLVGTPPTIVFVGKLTTLAAAWDGGLAWLAIIAVINSVASLFYYLRWLAPMFSRAVALPLSPSASSPVAAVARVRRRWAAGSAVTGAASVLVLGIVAGGILSIAGSPLVH